MRGRRKSWKVAVILELPGVTGSGGHSKEKIGPLDGENGRSPASGACVSIPIILRRHVFQKPHRISVQVETTNLREIARERRCPRPPGDRDVCFCFLFSAAELSVDPALRNRDELRDSAGQVCAIQPVCSRRLEFRVCGNRHSCTLQRCLVVRSRQRSLMQTRWRTLDW